MKIQKVVRTFPNGYTKTIERLSDLLNSGFLVVMCNPTYLENGRTCLEYIVEKEVTP